MTLGVFQHESAAGGDGDGEDGEHEGGGAALAGEFHLLVVNILVVSMAVNILVNMVVNESTNIGEYIAMYSMSSWAFRVGSNE